MRWWPKHDPDWQRATAAQLATLQPQRQPAAPGITGGLFRDLQVISAVLPARSAAPGRLLFCSDLHWNCQDPHAGDELVAAINALAPDWLVFGGDLITYMQFMPTALTLLGRLTARHGKFAVFGNWERRKHWCPESYWRDVYRQAGFRLLVNEVAESAGLLLAGYDDLRWGKPDFSILPAAAATGPALVVGIAHEPHTFAHGGDQFAGHLLLSGHTHAGQIRLPRFGALHTSNPYWKQFECGWYRRRTDAAWLHINAGLGCSGSGFLRRRIFCPPELVAVTLTAE